MRPAMRLAALMETPSIFILLTIPSVLAKMGRRTNPIEQLAAFAAMPK